ncbi:MAG: CotH kinase family protein [Peptostreptococcaceae bacterium]
MIKDVLKAIMAFSFVFIAILSASYLQDIKENYKEESKTKKQQDINNIYDSDSYDYGFNLPVIVIDTGGKVINSDKEITSQIQIYDNYDNEDNKAKLNYLIEEPTLNSDALIKIRGNSSKYFPKKQYGLELINKKGNGIDEQLLGMDKESDWVLNGPFADKSLMRNYIAYKTAENIMEYAPDVRFCEVFVVDDNSNNLNKKHYKGVYMLTEKIKRSDDRVDILKSQNNIDETSFIIAKDRNRENDIFINTYGKETYIYNYGINIKYPQKDLTPEKYDYISRFINEFERVLYSDKFNDPVVGYEKYIDVDSFVDFYIINEFFYNTDAGLYSTYFYKNYNEKMKAGPIWDFNRAIGNNETVDMNVYEYKGFFMNSRSWFDKLIKDYKFSSKVVDRYKNLRKTYLSNEYLMNMIDENVDYLGDAIDRNFTTWPIYMTNQADMFSQHGELFKPYENDPKEFDRFLKENEKLFASTKGMANSYEEEINLMKKFIVNRGKWLDENIDTLSEWSNY